MQSLAVFYSGINAVQTIYWCMMSWAQSTNRIMLPLPPELADEVPCEACLISLARSGSLAHLLTVLWASPQGKIICRVSNIILGKPDGAAVGGIGRFSAQVCVFGDLARTFPQKRLFWRSTRGRRAKLGLFSSQASQLAGRGQRLLVPCGPALFRCTDLPPRTKML